MADLALFDSVMGSEFDTVGCVDVAEVVAVGVGVVVADGLLVSVRDSDTDSVVHEHEGKYPVTARQRPVDGQSLRTQKLRSHAVQYGTELDTVQIASGFHMSSQFPLLVISLTVYICCAPLQVSALGSPVSQPQYD